MLDAESTAGLETLQALGRAGVRVDACCQNGGSLAFKSRYTHRRVHQYPPASVEEFIDWLRSIDESNGYTLIVPATEFSLLAFLKLPESDPLRRKAVLPSNEALATALDKQRSVDFALQLGIAVPHSVSIASIEQIPPAPAFPLVLKPAKSTVRIGDRLQVVPAVIIQNESERQDFLRSWVPYVPVLQQAYIPGHGLGVEMLYDQGREIWHFAHERVHEIPLTGGGSSYRRSLKPPEALLAAARKFLGTLRWHGVAMVEFRVERGGGFYLMEINPRLWGSLALAIDAGVNFPLGLLRIAAGEGHPSQPAYRKNYYTRNLKSDVEWLKANFKADRQNPFLLTRSRWISLVEYLRPLWGGESWDHFDIRDLAVTRAVLGRIVAEHAGKVVRLLQRRSLNRKVVEEHARRYNGSACARARVQRILFLCYGNMCRSPFAEEVAKKKLHGYEVESAGLRAAAGRQSPGHLISAARLMGIDLANSRSKRVTARQVEDADLILVMDLETHEILAQEFPQALPRATLLGLFACEPALAIPDPYSMTEMEARRVLGQICEAVDGLSGWLSVSQDGALARDPRPLGTHAGERTGDATASYFSRG